MAQAPSHTGSTVRQFRDNLKGAEDKLSVWHYFLRSDDGEVAQCKNVDCKEIRKCTKGNTTGLLVHLKTKHQIDLKAQNEAEKQSRFSDAGPSTGPPKKIAKITDHFEKMDDRCLEMVLARMTSRDGLSFAIFCTSIDLRRLLMASGFSELPRSPTSIRDKVVVYAEMIRSKYRASIDARKSEGKKFSATFDEWSSTRNRRYLNVIVHGGRYPGLTLPSSSIFSAEGATLIV